MLGLSGGVAELLRRTGLDAAHVGGKSARRRGFEGLSLCDEGVDLLGCNLRRWASRLKLLLKGVRLVCHHRRRKDLARFIESRRRWREYLT